MPSRSDTISSRDASFKNDDANIILIFDILTFILNFSSKKFTLILSFVKFCNIRVSCLLCLAMIKLILHIEHLIFRNECVIVPGFGAFIAEKVPAYINKESGTFMPPSRRLSFNPRIDHTDGMLVTSLMRRHRWSYALASESLGVCVAAL